MSTLYSNKGHSYKYSKWDIDVIKHTCHTFYCLEWSFSEYRLISNRYTLHIGSNVTNFQ